MHGVEYLIPIVALVLIFGLKGFREIKDFLLRKEQIKAEALVKAEALRLKNEIELEKLIHNDQKAEAADDLNKDRQPNSRVRS